MKMSKKALALMLSMMLVFGCAVGGTVAWLTATTDNVVNTFTVGNINIELAETPVDEYGVKAAGAVLTVGQDNTYKMIPGSVYPKDPTVTVKADSEACYLFIKVVESANFDTFMTYSINTAENEWKALDGQAGVYYREVNAATAKAGKEYNILGSGSLEVDGKQYNWSANEVLVKPNVTKDTMNTVGENKPTLTFKAAAVQSANIGNVTDAWAQVSALLA